MALDLGKIFTKLAVDFSDMEKAERRGRKFAAEAEKGFGMVEKTGAGVKKAGRAMLGLSAATLGFGLASAKMANDFDQNIAEVNSLLPQTQRDFQGLKRDVRGVALALGTDLNKGASAAYQAISAGVPRDNLVDFLRVGTKAAIAGVTDTKVAVDGISTVMNAWGESAGSAGDVADIMFTAVKNGKTTFEELSRSMFQAAGIAPEVGVEFKEIAAAIATMTKQGVPTSVAMTQLRQAMVSLVKPNETMFSLLKKAGIENVKAALATEGLAATYERLRKAAEENGGGLEEAVGSVEALGAVLKLTGGNAKAFQQDLKAMESSAGAMESAFEEIDRTRGFDKIVNQLKAVVTIIGDALIPILMPLAQQFAQVLHRVHELDPAMVRIGVVIGGIVAAMGPVLIGLGMFINALGSVAGVVGAVTGAIGAPLLAVLAAIAAGVALMVANWQKVKGVWEEIVRVAVALWDKLDALLEPIGGIEGAWEALRETVERVAGFLTRTVGTMLDGMKTNLAILADLIEGNITVWEAVKLAWENAKTVLVKITGDLIGEIKKAWSEVDWEALGKAVVDGILKGMVKNVGRVYSMTSGIGKNMVKRGMESVEAKSPSEAFKRIGRYIMEGWALGMNQNKQLPLSSVNSVGNELIKQGSQLQSEYVAANVQGYNSMNSALDSFASRTTDLLTGIGSQWKSFGDVVKSVIRDYANNLARSGIANLGKSLLGGGGGFLGKVFGGVRSLLGFAGGGRPPINQDVVVGEHGPEIVRIQKPSTVFPTGMNAAGAGGPVVNVEMNFSNGVDETRLRESAELMKQQMLEAFAEVYERAGAFRRRVNR